MRVKTFRGPNTESVLRRIKGELGPDAVILETRNVRDNGSSCCEMTAALDEIAGEAMAADRNSPAGPAPGWGQWHQEWNSIKEHLSALLRPQVDLGSLAPRQRLALEYLEREGVSFDVVLEIFRALKDNPDQSVLGPLERIVRVQPLTPAKWSQRLHAFAGPHGVGKTSVLLRVAMAMRREHPGLSVCIVNTDSQRSHGKLVLKHYAELSDMTYAEVADRKDVAALLAEAKRYDLVLFDLPGLARDELLEGFLFRLGLDKVDDLAVHLVLSPQYSPEQHKAFLRQYRSPLVASLVWTKLDEAFNYGAMVNAAQATGLPASALSFGTGLSETLAPARHSAVWRLVFKHQFPGCEHEDN